MEQAGKRLIKFGLISVMVGCLGLVGCNRHAAHDDDDDDGPAPAAADTATTVNTDSPASSSNPAASATNSTAPAEATPPPAPSPAAPAPVAETAPPPEPAAEPAPAEQPAKPAHTAAESGEHQAASASSRDDSAWWASSASSPFSVRAVGGAADHPALVVVLSSDVGDAAAAGQHIHVTHQGQSIPGAAWHKGANGHVLVFDPLKPGRYSVVIDRDLASADGKTLGSKLHGSALVYP